MKFNQLIVCCLFLALPVFAKVPPTVSPAALPQGLTIADWTQIRAEYERHRHAMFPAGNGYVARGFEQQWLAHFDSRGFLVKPDNHQWSWGLQLLNVSGAARMIAEGNRLTYRWSADLDEWFVNDTRGLEHGFTLNAPREIRLAVRGGLSPRATAGGVEFLDSMGMARLRYTGLKAWDATGRPLPAKMNVVSGTVALSVDDRGARYPITIDPIAQQAYLKASNAGADDLFGVCVGVSGDTVVVAAQQEDSAATGVNGNQADNSAPDSGAVYVFVRSGPAWSQQAYLKASNAAAGDWFGLSVAISGDTIVVGALQEDSAATAVNGNQADNSAIDSGAAYVFVRNGTTWTQQAYLKASNAEAGDIFGYNVAISGDTILVATIQEDSAATGVNGNQADNSAASSGAVYVYQRTGAAWAQQAYLKASNTAAGDWFGRSIAISGDTVVVGASEEDSAATGVGGNQADDASTASGAAYIFVRSGTNWAQQAYLKASNTGAGDRFGSSVALFGNTAVVGVPGEDSNATGVNGNQADDSASGSGAAYLFVRAGSTWSQQAYLKPSNTALGYNFGVSAAISGDTVVIGAHTERSTSTGINGSQVESPVTGANAGASYLFSRTGTNWVQTAYIKASNTDARDLFGLSVAIDADNIVISGVREDSSATAINGNQADNTATDAGAVYLYNGLTTAVTINSSPAGLLFTSTGAGCAPGAGYATPQVLSWTPGALCSVSFPSPQSGPGNVPYGISKWEDNSASPARSIIAPPAATTYTATFLTQFPLTTAASPAAGGTITPGGNFNSGTNVNVTATPNPGYIFAGWSGACTGTAACSVPMDAAKSVTANFTAISTVLNTTQTGALAVSGTTQTLVFRFTHTSGFAQLGVVNALINQYLNGDFACYIAYSQPLGVLYLVNDLGPGSGISAGLTLGGTGSVSNSQCTINSAGSSAVGSGNTLTLTLNVTYKAAFLGNKVIYVAAGDQSGNSTGWSTVGATIVPETAPVFPRAGTMSPPTGTTATATLAYTFLDATSTTNLQTAWALINNAIDGRQACYVAYYIPGNALYLYPDNGDGTQATSIVLTGTNTIENSQCRISAQGSSVTVTGNQLTLNLNYTFKTPFAGPRAVWTATQTTNGAQTSPWKPVGGWLVP